MSLRKIALAVVMAMSCAAIAQPAPEKPRHFDFTQTLTGFDGKPIINGDAKNGSSLTLGEACINALEATLQSDAQTTGADKFKLDQLARKIYRSTDVVLSIEEIALLKERIGKVYSPVVVGAAWRVLDPSDNK
jgi:hypothetical protein